MAPVCICEPQRAETEHRRDCGNDPQAPDPVRSGRNLAHCLRGRNAIVVRLERFVRLAEIFGTCRRATQLLGKRVQLTTQTPWQ